MTNRKSYVGFRLQQKLMTLNDLERDGALCGRVRVRYVRVLLVIFFTFSIFDFSRLCC